MTAIRMMLSELQRLTAGRLPKIAMFALAIVPTLYGGLYLYANHDPYGRLDQVPAALVVLDQGGTLPSGTALNAGREVAGNLLDQKTFDWHEVSAAKARVGVKEGRYDFALTIPANFTEALTSSARFTPEKARLSMTTNDANSYLSTTIADTVVSRVRAAITERVGSEAATQFLLGFGEIRGSLEEAAAGAEQLHRGLTEALSGARSLNAGSAKLQSGAGTLAGGLTTLQQRTASLPRDTARLANGALQVADGNARVAQVGDNVREFALGVQSSYTAHRGDLVARMNALGMPADQQLQILGVYDRMRTPIRDAVAAARDASGQLDRLSDGASQVATGTRRLADSTPAVVAGIRQARSGAGQLATGAGQLRTGSAALTSGLTQLDTGAGTLATKLRAGIKEIPSVDEASRNRIASTIANPIAVDDVAQTKADSYGAGLAPFFLALAAWIGGYVLFLLVRPLSRRAMAANQAPLRVAVAGWLTPALIGVAQMAVLLAVVSAAVDIVPENLPGSLLFLIGVSATFVAIVHALNAWLGTAGQFLGLVLMVLQLVSAGGTFPWQTLPEPLQALHHVLPMSYAVDGLRQLMYGGLSGLVVRDALVLLAWFAAALAATTLAARKQRIWSLRVVKPELAM
ncbi:MAG: YhgE/Pip domain-containing protein [Nocardioidaceae bacterium]|nr:YhgE/Pip domain-containing protein [Nocardioidaceae bacterium]